MRLQCFTNGKHTLKNKRGSILIKKGGFNVLETGNTPLKRIGT
jgi:hypothetical protein